MVRCYVTKAKYPYRSAQNSSTGFTANLLMLGREVHWPQEIWLGVVEQAGSVQDLEKS